MHGLRVGLLLAVFLSACSSTMPELGSIGVVLGRRSTGEVFVREVPNPTLTELKPNDELLFVGGKAITTFDEKGLKQALRGPSGSTLDLTVVREGAIKRLRVVRTDVVPAHPPAPPK